MTPRQRAYGRGYLFRKKRKDGTERGAYLMRYYVGAKQRHESTRTTDLTVATRMLNDRMGGVASGQAPAEGAHRITVADLLADYENFQELERRPSLRTTRTHLVHLTPALGAIRAADLTTRHLGRFVTAQRRAGYAEQTIALELSTLKAALNLGRRAKPQKVVTLPEFPKLDVSGNVRQGFATKTQAFDIFEDLTARDADLGDAAEWTFWTGMRKGAVSRLGWEFWDYETEMLRLPPAGRRKKTPLAIPLRKGNPLRAIIDRRWERRKERAKETGRLEPLIFWRVYRGHPTAKGLRAGDAAPVYEYRKAWAHATAAAGCPNLTVHDLRRTAVRNAWFATKDRRTAMLLSGHLTEATFDRYNIDKGEQLVGHLAAIADYVAALPEDARPDVPVIPRAPRRKASR